VSIASFGFFFFLFWNSFACSTFGPPIEAPHPVRYYVGKPPQTFRAPRLTVESVYEAPVEYTTQTVTVFSGFFSPSEFSSGAPTISVAIFLVIATLALVF